MSRVGSVAQPAALDRKLAERAQGHEPTTGSVRRLGVEQRLDPFRRQERKRPVAICRAEALKDSAPHALRAWTFRSEELLRVQILGDDGAHAARLDAPRTDGSARPGQRGLVCCHEGRRPGQAGQAHARIAASAEIAMRATIVIDPMLHIFRELHCFVTLRSASHGLLASVGANSPKCSTVPSGVVTLVTVLPLLLRPRDQRADARLARALRLRLLWLRFLLNHIVADRL